MSCNYIETSSRVGIKKGRKGHKIISSSTLSFSASLSIDPI